MEEGSKRTYSHAEWVNPLLNGFLTGQLHGWLSYTSHSFSIDQNNNNNKLPLLTKPPLRSFLLRTSIGATASLGIFEILTEKLRNGNGGEPLTLFQEARCGFISGSTAVLLRTPFDVASKRIGIHALTSTNWFTTLHQMLLKEGASSLWRGHGVYMSTDIAAYTGILAAYDRSRNYFVETQGLPNWRAHICSSTVSGFFAAACANPVHHVGGIISVVQKRKLGYSRILPCIRTLVTPYSGCNFYTDFLRRFHYATIFCMVQFAILEEVRRMVGKKKQE